MGARITVRERELLGAELDDLNSNKSSRSTSKDHKAPLREKREFNLMQ